MKDIFEYYSYRGLIDEAVSREKHSVCDYEASRTGSLSFTQTQTFDEAVQFGINGWDLGLEQYKVQEGVLVGGSTEMQPNLAGCFPHVQNHIMGLPQQMYQLYDEREYNLPTLDIVVNLAYPASVDSNDTLELGKSLVSFINNKAATRNIRLTGVFASNARNNTQVYQMITLKDFDTSLVINNIAYAFHPSFFRRIWFSVLEGKEYWQSGYGTAISDYKTRTENKLEGVKSEEVMFFKNFGTLNRFSFTDENVSEMLLK